MLDFDTAQAQLAQRAIFPVRTETAPLHALNGRILATDVRATLDLPPADNSAMDGYAIRMAEVSAGTTLPIQQRCFAGQNPEPLKPGHAIRLFTGSLVPSGADAIVMQEDTQEDGDQVTFHRSVPAGNFIRVQGEDMARGQAVLRQGTLLEAAQIAVLAAQGLAHAPVFPRLSIGILTTGDELVIPGEPLRAASIYDSNAPMLASLCTQLGTEQPIVRRAPDDVAAIEQALQDLNARCDLVLSVGGASVGEKDLVKPALQALGGTLDLWRVRMKPGKPVALAELNGRPLVCLPGNPVSSFVVFVLLVSPLIRGLQGRHTVFPAVRHGILGGATPRGGEREEFLRVQDTTHDGQHELVPYPQQSSGAISSLSWAHGLARIPAGQHVKPGADVAWYAFQDWLK
ncbi:MAG TPA: gephyrin-like molybdotransferase Glp [Castellaniella sp.]|uniref:molybdopterin molybdotransferase MoeA n=1 Tax=Castellaniella sp. TaxID=1955812 RepID=UPI002F03C700